MTDIDTPPRPPEQRPHEMTSAEKAACWICHEGSRSGPDGKLQSAGCGCRGALGMVHRTCVTKWAVSQNDPPWSGTSKSWVACPTCKLSYTNTSFLLQLACDRWDCARASGGGAPGADTVGLALDADGLDAMYSLGKALWLHGVNDKAKSYLEHSVELARQTFGNANVLTMRMVNTLGAFYAALGDNAAARPLTEEALAALQELGADHLEVISTRQCLAMLEDAVGNLALAVRLHEQVLQSQ